MTEQQQKQLNNITEKFFKQMEQTQTPKRNLTLGHLGCGTGKVAPFDQVFNNGVLVTPKDIEDGAPIDALVIWGGADISPSIYGHNVSSFTGAGPTMSPRDQLEVAGANASIKRSIPIVGICRGAQLVCGLAGGHLIQHVSNHGVSHPIDTIDGKTLISSSVHHQMMYPFDVKHDLIAWASKKRSTTYRLGDDSECEEMADHPEPEIVWFPEIKALAIQGHPEFHAYPEKDEFVQYCMDLVRKYVV